MVIFHSYVSLPEGRMFINKNLVTLCHFCFGNVFLRVQKHTQGFIMMFPGVFPGAGWRIGGCFAAEICLELWESSRSSAAGSPQGTRVATGVGCCGMWCWQLWWNTSISLTSYPHVSPKILNVYLCLNFFFRFFSCTRLLFWAGARITRTWWKLLSRGNRLQASQCRNSAVCRRFCWRPSMVPPTLATRCLDEKPGIQPGWCWGWVVGNDGGSEFDISLVWFGMYYYWWLLY